MLRAPEALASDCVDKGYGFDIRQPLYCAAIALQHGTNVVAGGKYFDRHLLLLLDFQLGANVADADDQVLQDRHRGFGVRVHLRRIGQRIARQRNRLGRRLAIIDSMPEFLGDERHERRQQPQRAFEDADQVRVGHTRGFAIVRHQPRLDQFQIPVAELAPEKVIDHVRGFVKAEGIERIVNFLRDAVEAGENPAVFQGFGFET